MNMEGIINQLHKALGESFMYREMPQSPKKTFVVKSITEKDGKYLIKTDLRTFFWLANEIPAFLEKCTQIENFTSKNVKSIQVNEIETVSKNLKKEEQQVILATPVYQISENCDVISKGLMEKFKKLTSGNVSNEFLKETREMVAISGQVIEIEKLKLMTYLKTK